MGFKTATVFVTTKEPEYFSTNPTYLPEKAEALIEQLGLGPAVKAQENLWPYTECMYPPENQFFLGAYEHGFILSDRGLFEFSEEDNALRKRVLKDYLTANLLAIVLHSVVNLYGYDIYEKGKRIRFLTGSSDDGVIHDFGDLQPEEKPIFDQSSIVNGERIFKLDVNGTLEDFDMSSAGESLVFAVAKRYLGFELDRFQEDGEPQMQQFNRVGAKISAKSNQAKSQPSDLLSNVLKFFGPK